MSAASSPPCWANVVFLVLENDFFFNRKNKQALVFLAFFIKKFFLEISAINHEKV